METLQKSPAANKLLPSLMVKASNAYGDVAKNVKMPPEIESQMARTSCCFVCNRSTIAVL